MKNVIVLALTTLISSIVIAAEPPASPSEIIRGDVRFVLMSVGQTTIFPNGNPNEPKLDTKLPATCFVITYLVEHLGDRPVHLAPFSGYEISTAGKSLALIKDQHIHYQKQFDYESFPDFLNLTKPNVTNRKRAQIYQHIEFGAVPNLQPFDLLIREGVGDDVQEFKFSSLRLQ